MKTVIISNTQYKFLSESKMRGWSFIDDIERASCDIFFHKEEILNSNEWKEYNIGDKFKIKVSNYKVFAQTYPLQKNAGGFMLNKTLIFYIRNDFTKNNIMSHIMHELEHAIDYENDTYPKIVNAKQRNLQSLAYAGVYSPQQKNDVEEQTLENDVRNILYHYWINTEKNAFIAQTITSYKSIADEINQALNSLKKINDIDADKHSSFWFSMSQILQQRTRGVEFSKLTPQRIKKHFINQSYHKIKQYEKVASKKLMYAKMNGISNANASINGRKIIPPPPSQSEIKPYYIAVGQTTYGPYSLLTLQRFVQERRLVKNSYVWKEGLQGWVKAKDLEDTKQLFN